MSKTFVYFFDSYWRTTNRAAPYFEVGIAENGHKCCTLYFLNHKVGGYGCSKNEAKNNAAKNLLRQLPERFQQLYAGYIQLLQEINNATCREIQNRPTAEFRLNKAPFEEGLKNLFKDDIMEATHAKKLKQLSITHKKHVKTKKKGKIECFAFEQPKVAHPSANEDDFKLSSISTATTNTADIKLEVYAEPAATQCSPTKQMETVNEIESAKIREFFKEIGFEATHEEFNGMKEISVELSASSLAFGETCDAYEADTQERTGVEAYENYFIRNAYENYTDDYPEYYEYGATREECCENANRSSFFENALRSICQGPIEALQLFLQTQLQLSAKWYFNSMSKVVLKYDLPQLRVIRYVMTPEHNHNRLVQLCMQHQLPSPMYHESCMLELNGRRYQVTVSVSEFSKTISSKDPDKAYKQIALLLYDAILKLKRNPIHELYELCAGDSNGMPVICVARQDKQFQATCRVGKIERIGFGDDEETAKKNATHEMLYYLTTISASKSRVLEEAKAKLSQHDSLKFKHYRRLTASDNNAKHIDFTFRHLYLYKTDDERKLLLKRLLQLHIKSAETRVLTILHILNIKLKETIRVDRKGQQQVFIEFIGCELDTVFVGPKHQIYERVLQFLIEMTF